MSMKLRSEKSYPLRNRAWNNFMEYMGDSWPDFALKKLYSCSLGYKDRLFVVAHAYQNGMPIDYLIQLLYAVNSNINRNKETAMRGIYNYITHPRSGPIAREKYYAYDMILGGVYYLNKVKKTT